MPNRMVPMNLKHKPIYAINDYDKIDGDYKNNTDVYGLSLGKAQWSSEFIPSIKVWRKVETKNNIKRWSRQSEETTITRAVDMAMLSVKVMGGVCKSKTISNYNTPFGQKIEIEQTAHYCTYEKELKDYLCSKQADIETHLKMLKDTLDEYFK